MPGQMNFAAQRSPLQLMASRGMVGAVELLCMPHLEVGVCVCVLEMAE